ncbi:MAG: single-stranded DNA-binding protein [bacterium]
MGYLKSGDSVIVWGSLSKDAKHMSFDSGTSLSTFSVKYGTQDKLYGDNGARKGKYMDVKAWGREYDHEICDLCACLEKGDKVLVAGTLTLDRKQNEDGSDRWYLNAEHVSVMQKIEAAEEEYAEDETEQEEEPSAEIAEEDYPEVLR